MSMNDFLKFTNAADTGAELYVYGTLVDGKDEVFGDPTDVDFTDFKNAIDSLKAGSNLNMYINSGGGSVFAASAMVSILNRAKQSNGIKVNAYIDGLCASAATYLAMVADNINVYKNSMMMIHKPMSIAMGNADDFQHEIDVLNEIQDKVMMPLYESKAKIGKRALRDMINAETWLSADEINSTFKVNVIDTDKAVVASVDKDLFKNYKNVPECFKKAEKTPKKTDIVNEPVIDYTEYENRIKALKINV